MRQSVDNVNHSEGDVLDLVHRVMHVYRSKQFHALRDGPHSITHMQAWVMSFFARRPGATQSDLAAHSGRDKAQLTRLVGELEALGLLTGAADPGDRRQRRLSLTAAGQTVQRSLAQQAARLNKAAAAGLNAGERQQLLGLLQRVKDNLDRH